MAFSDPRTMRTPLFTAFMTLSLLAGQAHSAEVQVLTAGAFKQVVLAVAPAFQQRTGDTLVIDNDTAGALEQRILRGTPFDVSILPPRVVDSLTEKGKLTPASKRNLARTGVGIVVGKNTARPDIRTIDALRRSLLAAPSIAYIDPASGGSSGVFVAQLLQRLGIADQVKAKTRLIQGGLVAQHVVDGEAELGIHQISEILAVKDAVLVGPLPEAIQSYTVYAGAISASTSHAEAAQALIDLLASADGASAIRESGLEPAR
jgi:molybdate transport system substrate-binding protein